MAERVMPRDAQFQKTLFADNDQQTVYNKALDRNDNAEFSDMKTYHQGTLPAQIADIESEIGSSSIKDVVLNQNVIPANISEAYNNISETDLTQLIPTGCTVTDSGQRINGQILYKVLATGANGFIKQFGIPFTADGQSVIRWTIRKGNTDAYKFRLTDTISALKKVEAEITFSTQSIVYTFGTELKAKWVDENTLYLYSRTDSIVFANNVDSTIFAGTEGNAIGDYVYLAESLIVQNTSTMFPFINGSKTADVINKEFVLQSKSIHYLEIDPKFLYDTVTGHAFGSFRVDANSFFNINYEPSAPDQIILSWKDTGTLRFLALDQMGPGFLELNQKLYLFLITDLSSGIAGDSSAYLFDESGVLISSVLTFNAAPDIMVSDFNTASVGHFNSSAYADSPILWRIFPWFTSGAITKLSDVWTALAGKTPLFSATSSPTVDRDSIDENTSTQNAIEKNASSIQLLKSFDNPHYIGSTNEPVFLNLWVNGAGSYSNAYYIKRSDGWVDVYGEIITGTVDQNAFEFDNGWKPFYKKDKTFPVESNGAFGAVTITADGFLKPITPSSNTSVILDGISFYAGF